MLFMVTAVFPIRMTSRHPFTKSTPTPPTASSSQTSEASTSSSVAPEPSAKPFGKIRSQLETLRSATRSRARAAPPPEDFATVRVKTVKGKEKALPSDEVPKESKEGGRSGFVRRIESKIGLRPRRESITRAPAPIPPPIIGRTKDGGEKNVKIQETERVRSGEFGSFDSPLLYHASTSSPAIHLSSQAIPSPKSQSAVYASSSSTASIPTSPPPRDGIRRSSLQQSPAKEISGPTPLSARRDSRSHNVANGNSISGAKEPKTSRRPPPLREPSPSLLTSTRTRRTSTSPVSLPRRGHERPQTPETPTPPSRGQHTKAAASMGNIPLRSPSASPTTRTASPTTRAKSPSTRGRVVTPSQRGFRSASTSQLPLNTSPTQAKLSFESHRRAPNDASRRPSVDDQRRPAVNSQRRSSIDTPRRGSMDHQRRPSDSPRSPREVSPSTPVRPRPITPIQRTYSPSYGQNRHFNMSTSSLVSASTPEQRELIRSATSILCRELRKMPPHLSGSQTGLKEWDEVEHRMQHLVRAERIWGKSASILGANASQISVSGGASPRGLSVSGEERERRLFSEALGDGFVLCQCVS
jgi:hypothetical protein